MVGVHDVITEFIDIIEDNVTDPNTERLAKNKKWVWDDLPRADIGPDKYPRISVTAPTSNSIPHELNSNNQRVTARLEVQIRVKRTKWGSQTALQFLEDLSENVMNALRLDASRAQLLSNANVFYSTLEVMNTTQTDDMIIRQLVYKNIFKR